MRIFLISQTSIHGLGKLQGSVAHAARISDLENSFIWPTASSTSSSPILSSPTPLQPHWPDFCSVVSAASFAKIGLSRYTKGLSANSWLNSWLTANSAAAQTLPYQWPYLTMLLKTAILRTPDLTYIWPIFFIAFVIFFCYICYGIHKFFSPFIKLAALWRQGFLHFMAMYQIPKVSLVCGRYQTFAE